MVRFEVDPGTRVGLLTLDRPPLNLLGAEVWTALGATLAALGDRGDVGALVLWGGPQAFATGRDVGELGRMDRRAATASAAQVHEVLDALAGLPVVTIAALAGHVLGEGCELALACDLRLAADNTKMGMPEILLGLLPGGGATQRLPRLVGPSRAKDLILSGRIVDMLEAARIGLVDEVHPADEVRVAALARAARFAAGPAAQASAKELIDRSLDLALPAGLALERERYADMFDTEDAKVGLASFVADGPGQARFRRR